MLKVKDNDLTQRERVFIKNNSENVPYLEAFDGDGIDLRLNRANHRGTVKHGISQTIKTNAECGVIEIERDTYESSGDAEPSR